LVFLYFKASKRLFALRITEENRGHKVKWQTIIIIFRCKILYMNIIWYTYMILAEIQELWYLFSTQLCQDMNIVTFYFF